MNTRRMTDAELRAVLQCLRDGRTTATGHGHNCQSVSIGYDPCDRTTVLVADDSGSIEFGILQATGRFVARHNGAPSRALESTCLPCRLYADRWQMPR